MDRDLVLQKLDWIERQSSERHQENVARLARIETEVRQTNGRVTRHDEQIRSLFRITRPAKDHDEDVDRLPLTVGRMKALGQYGGWIAAGLLALLKLTGKL